MLGDWWWWLVALWWCRCPDAPRLVWLLCVYRVYKSSVGCSVALQSPCVSSRVERQDARLRLAKLKLGPGKRGALESERGTATRLHEKLAPSGRYRTTAGIDCVGLQKAVRLSDPPNKLRGAARADVFLLLTLLGLRSSTSTSDAIKSLGNGAAAHAPQARPGPVHAQPHPILAINQAQN